MKYSLLAGLRLNNTRAPFDFLCVFFDAGEAGPRTTAGRGFAVKFYDILSQESSDIIRWTESGQAFQVVDYNRFSEEILLKVGRVVGSAGLVGKEKTETKTRRYAPLYFMYTPHTCPEHQRTRRF